MVSYLLTLAKLHFGGQKYHKQMERVQVLIDKLVQQKQRNEPATQLLLTVQLLQNELFQLQRMADGRSSSKVAVVMPARGFATQEVPAAEAPLESNLPPVVQEPESPKPVAPAHELYPFDTPAPPRRAEPEVKEVQQPMPEVKPAASVYHGFDVVAETPTLLQQPPQGDRKPVREINQVINVPQLSLNDQLKQHKTELAHVLKETPVKDLRKAIGINDKFLFLNELFRGDEPMYERSIKTLNNFQVLQEAEYWMNRELKVKLGWNDNKESVQHFYQLVRRRFS